MDQDKTGWDDKEELLKRCISAEERAKLMESERGQTAQYQKAVQELQAENAIMQGRIQKLTQDIALKNQQIDELFKKWEHSDLNQMGLENLSLAQKLSGREDKIIKLESELQLLYGDYTAKYQKIIDELFKKWELNEQSLKDNQELLKRISSRDEQTEKLEYELRRLNAEFNQKYQKVLDLAVRVQESNQSFSGVKEELESLKRGQLDMNRQIQKLEQVKAAEYGEMAEVVKERVNNHLHHCLSAIEKESAETREKLQQEFNALEIRHREKEMQLERFNQRLEMFKDEIGFLRKDLESRPKHEDASAPADAQESQRVLEQIREMRTLLESHQAAWDALKADGEKSDREKSGRLAAAAEKIERLEKDMEQIRSQSALLAEKRETPEKISVPSPDLPKTRTGAAAQPAEEEPFAVVPPSKLPSGMSEFIMDDIQKDLVGLEPAFRDAEAPGLPPESSGGEAGKKLIRVIVAEHQPESLDQLQGCLPREDYNVLPASDGQTVLRLARDPGADLIVMNIAISDADSYTVSHELAKDPVTGKIPILLIASNPESAQIFKEDPLQTIKGYLYKPFSVKEFLELVRNVTSG